MIGASRPGRAAHLNDVARLLAPHLRIVSASRPTPPLRNYNVVAIADTVEEARNAVLALEAIEPADERLGTVVMGTVPPSSDQPAVADSHANRGGVDREHVARQVMARIVCGGLLAALVGGVLVGGAAHLLGATGWLLVGAVLAGAMLLAVWGAAWMTFAGLGGSDAYRQTFVDDGVTELTIVSLHTDDAEEARAAHEHLDGNKHLWVFDVDRNGHIAPTGIEMR